MNPLHIAAIVLIAQTGLAGTAVADRRNWIRGTLGPQSDKRSPLVRCEIVTVSSTGGHLACHALFINETNAVIQLEGEIKKDGTFWPFFTAESMIEDENEWQMLAPPENSDAFARVTVGPFSEKEISVDMDVFRKAIGKATFGRIVLTQGASAMFDLEMLKD